MQTVNVDASSFQAADDGNTTHYGGSVRVGDNYVQCSGTDRDSENCFDRVLDAVLAALHTCHAQCTRDDIDDTLEQLNHLITAQAQFVVVVEDGKLRVSATD